MTRLERALEKLSSASLVRPVLLEPQPAHQFRHTLDRQTAYQSILRKDREKLHKLIGDLIEPQTQSSSHYLTPDVCRLRARKHRTTGDKDETWQTQDQAQLEAEWLGARRMLWIIHAQRAARRPPPGDRGAMMVEPEDERARQTVWRSSLNRSWN